MKTKIIQYCALRFLKIWFLKVLAAITSSRGIVSPAGPMSSNFDEFGFLVTDPRATGVHTKGLQKNVKTCIAVLNNGARTLFRTLRGASNALARLCVFLGFAKIFLPSNSYSAFCSVTYVVGCTI